MAKDIFVIQTMGDALRNTGYKNIECAMAEIIDNSIQAEAKDILIIVSEEYNPETGRNNIKEIGFLDNGKGMEQIELESSLGIGYSRRIDRKGIGSNGVGLLFGVGLPQASLYACPSVDVYSWQNGYDNCKKVFLDINKVKDGEQTVLEDPVQSEIPSKYKKYLTYKMQGQNDAVKEYNFMESGTFVLWKNCDRVVPKTVSFLFKKLEFALGQKFRYFIHDGICNISLIHHENQDNSKRIMPNDPLFLMKPNYVLGNPATPENICPGDNINYTESIFEPYTDEKHTDGGTKISSALYRRYPNIVKDLKERPAKYNESMQKLFRLEKEGRVFVIAPDTTHGVGRTESDPKRLEELYEEGYLEGKEQMAALKNYLKK